MNLPPAIAAGRPSVGMRFRGIVVAGLVLMAGILATGGTAAAATCGKHFLVLQPGTRGALVSALVEQHHHELANSPTSPRRQKCDSPHCQAREQAPSAPSTPWTRITVSPSAVDMVWAGEGERALSARSLQFWNEAGLLYHLEPAPPPTPPPQS